MRWIGVDVGDARVGLAVSDESGRFVLPHETARAADAVDTIVSLADELQAGVVVGWPLEMSGREGRATQRVAVFVAALEQEAAVRGLTLTIHKRDERLTTGLAETLLDAAGVWGSKRKGVVDQEAAVQILQNFLEEEASRHGESEGD